MKITKKILAGTLALMNVFTVLSAEPVEIEKLPDTSTTAKDKKSKHESIKKKLVKEVAKATGTAAAFCGVVALIRNIFKTCNEKERIKIIDNSLIIFEWYSIAKIRDYIEKFSGESRLKEVLERLFSVLDGNAGLLNEQKIISDLEYAFHLIESGNDTLKISIESEFGTKVLKKRFCCDSKWCSPLDINEEFSKMESNFACDKCDTISIFVEGGANGFHNIENFMEIMCEKDKKCYRYSLTAVAMCGEKNGFFTTAYLENMDAGRWEAHSFENEICTDSIESQLFTLKKSVNLIYTKQK